VMIGTASDWVLVPGDVSLTFNDLFIF
jgi:hypothetical protein